MKKLILAACACAAVSFNVFGADKAGDPVLQNAQQAREQVADALSQYNKAVNANVNSAAILNDILSGLNTLRGSLAMNKSTAIGTDAALENLAQRKEVLRAQFAQNQNFLDMSGQSMTALAGFLPIGDERIKSANTLAQKGMTLVNLNPGERYADHNYMTAVIARYNNAVSVLRDTQQRASKFAVSLAIAKPRIEGITQTLKLHDDFYTRAEKSAQSNNEKLRTLEKQVNTLGDAYLKTYGTLADSRAELRAERVKLLRASLAVQALLLNDLAKSEKYKDATFPLLSPEDMAAIVVRTRGKEEAGDVRLSGGSANPWGAPAGSLIRKEVDSSANADTLLQSPLSKSSGVGGASAMAAIDSLSAPKTAKEEVLVTANSLLEIAAEINRTSTLLSDILSDAQKAMDAIERNESQSQQLLRECMDAFTRTQTLSANLDIFTNTLAVSGAQADASNEEFKKLTELCKAHLKQTAQARQSATQAKDAALKAL